MNWNRGRSVRERDAKYGLHYSYAEGEYQRHWYLGTIEPVSATQGPMALVDGESIFDRNGDFGLTIDLANWM